MERILTGFEKSSKFPSEGVINNLLGTLSTGTLGGEGTDTCGEVTLPLCWPRAVRSAECLLGDAFPPCCELSCLGGVDTCYINERMLVIFGVTQIVIGRVQPALFRTS